MEESSPPAPPRRWYQFSLREILLTTVALSAVLALIVNKRPFSPTRFFDSFDAAILLANLESRLNLGLETLSGSEIFSGRGTEAFRSCEYTIGSCSYSTICRTLMPALWREVEQQLVDSGCKIEKRITTGSPMREFSFNYSSGNVRGKIKVWALEGPDGKTHLRMETDEW